MNSMTRLYVAFNRLRPINSVMILILLVLLSFTNCFCFKSSVYSHYFTKETIQEYHMQLKVWNRLTKYPILQAKDMAIQASMKTKTNDSGLFANNYLLNKAILAQGIVASGYGRGSRKLGFPTANLPYFNEALQEANIKNGVYFGWGKVQGNEHKFPCIANIGLSPTFVGEENRVKIIETYLIEKAPAGTPIPIPAPKSTEHEPLSDFYGQLLRISLIGHLREEKKFDSIKSLVAQIASDVEQAYRLLLDIEAQSSLGSSTDEDDLQRIALKVAKNFLDSPLTKGESVKSSIAESGKLFKNSIEFKDF